jgi:hypothetical protein
MREIKKKIESRCVGKYAKESSVSVVTESTEVHTGE